MSVCNTGEGRCEAWMKNMAQVHCAALTAALNGTTTKLDLINFCPWCGKQVNPDFKPDPNYIPGFTIGDGV